MPPGSAAAIRSSSTKALCSFASRSIWIIRPAWATRAWAAWMAIRVASGVGESPRMRSTARCIAIAAWAARRGASSTGSTPKAASRARCPRASTRPPKLSTFSIRVSSARAASERTSPLSGTMSVTRIRAMGRRSQRTVGGAVRAAGPGTALCGGGAGVGRVMLGARASRFAATGVPSRSPSFSMRARTVLREMLRMAAVREMFQPV